MHQDVTSLAYGNSQCFIHIGSQFGEKITAPPIKQILSLLLSKNTIMLQQLIFHSSQLGGDGRLKTKENFKILALKVVAVAYERW